MREHHFSLIQLIRNIDELEQITDQKVDRQVVVDLARNSPIDMNVPLVEDKI